MKSLFFLNDNHDWLKDVKLRPGHSDELPQYDEFIETYGIKEGDGMYVATDDRIAVW